MDLLLLADGLATLFTVEGSSLFAVVSDAGEIGCVERAWPGLLPCLVGSLATLTGGVTAVLLFRALHLVTSFGVCLFLCDIYSVYAGPGVDRQAGDGGFEVRPHWTVPAEGSEG